MDFETEVRKLVPEDGDIIVIRTTRTIRPEQVNYIQSAMTEVLRKVGKKAVAIVLDDGITIEILKTSALADRVAA